jgi:hypothetical protein
MGELVEGLQPLGVMMNHHSSEARPTPRQIGGIVYAKHVALWGAALAAAAVLAVLFAAPVGMTIVTLLPLGVILAVCVAAYAVIRVWMRNTGEREGHEVGHARLVSERGHPVDRDVPRPR